MINYEKNLLLNHYRENKIQILTCFISTFIFGLTAHAYGLLNNIFSHDSLNAIYADRTEELAKISVGRFIVPFIRLFRGPVAIPWVIGIIALMFIGLSVYVIVKMFDVKSKPAIIFISGIMVTNTTVTATVATYVHEFDLDMAALLLSVLSVYFWQKELKPKYVVLSIVLIVLSAGIYQSYICTAAVLMIFILIFRLFDGDSFKNVFGKGVLGVAVLGIGTVIYYTLQKLTVKLADVDIALRTDVINISDFLSGNVTYLNGINATIYYEIMRIIKPTSTTSSYFMGGINIILLVTGVLTALYVIGKMGKGKIKEKLLVAVLIAAIPVAAGFIGIVTKGEIHDVMVYALWMTYVFLLLLIARYGYLIKKTKLHSAVKVISLLCVFAVIWNNILVANTAYLKKDLEQKSTLATMTRIISDLEKRDDYVAGETPVYFNGTVYGDGTMPGFDSVSGICGLEFDNTIGSSANEWYFCSYEKYFKYFMNYPLKVADNTFEKDERISEMPVYPDKGYIQNIDGVIVVRID